MTHVPYLAVLGAAGRDTSLASNSWHTVTDIITDALSNAAAKSNFVKQAFEGEYPKLVRHLHHLVANRRFACTVVLGG